MADRREEDRRVARRVAGDERAVPHKVKQRRCQQCGITFPADEVVQDHDENGTPTGWFCLSCI